MPAACPNCGRGIDRSDQFCDACGAFLGWEAGESAESQLFPEAGAQRDDQRAASQLQLKSDLIKVAPGNAESTAFTVKNLGTKVEEFRFVVTGPEWIVAEPAAVSVYPGQEATGAVQAAPPRKPSSAAGVTPFRLTVTSALHTRVSSSAAGRVDVAPYYELAAELVPTSSSGRGLTRHRVTLDNRGNVPLRVALNPADVAAGLRLGVPAFADAPPGTVTEVPVSVYGSRRWIGRPEPKTFSVIAEPPKPLAPTRLPGTRIVSALFPRWVPAAAAGLLAVAVAGTAAARLTAHTGTSPPPAASSPASSPPTSPATSASSSTSSSTSSTTTSSSTSSATGSVSATVVAVPNVTGTSLPSATAALTAAGLVPQPQASYDSATPPDTVVQTNPTAGASVSPGSTVQVLVPTGSYNMVETAQSPTQWTATSQGTPSSASLVFGQQSPSTGEVFFATPAMLADCATVSQALETVPPPDGTITGTYNLNGQTIAPNGQTIAGEVFRADIGFLQGSSGQTATYQVFAIVGGSPQPLVPTSNNTISSGQVLSVMETVPAGTTEVELMVTAQGSTSASDDVVWVGPTIEESNAPAPPLPPTASPSQSPCASPT